MSYTRLKTTALHESGHLLAAILNGSIITEVRISNGGGEVVGSHRGHFGMGVGADHFQSKQSVLIFLAGPAAVLKLQKYFKGHELMEDVPDCMMFLRMKGWSIPYPDYSNMDFFLDYSTDAKRFVDHPIRWKMINTLAEMLMKKRRVSGQQVVKFFEDEAAKLPASDQMELLFPKDNLGGDQLPYNKHKN